MFEKFEGLLNSIAMLERLGGGGGGEKENLTLQNLALRNIKLQRDLSEPSPYQAQQEERRYQAAKTLYTDIKDIGLSKETSDATREHLFSMIENHQFGLPDRMRALLAPVLKNTPLDPAEQKLRFFEQHYGHTRPQKPMTALTGSGTAKDPHKIGPAPMNEENEAAWAEYLLRSADYKYRKDLFTLGKEAMQGSEPSQYVQIFQRDAEKVGDKMVEPAQRFWHINRNTNQVSWTTVPMSEAEKKKALDWGFTSTHMLENDFIPTRQPFEGTYKGQPFSFTEGVSMTDRMPKTNMQTRGEPIKDQKTFMPLLKIFGALRTKAAPKDIKDLFIRGAVTFFKDIDKQVKNPATLNNAIVAANNWVQQMMPNFPYRLHYFREGDEKPWYSSSKSNRIKLNDENWGLIPATEPVTYSNGVTVHYSSQTGEYSDATGQDITKEAQGTRSGDPMPSTLEPRAVVLEPGSIATTDKPASNDLTIGELLRIGGARVLTHVKKYTDLHPTVEVPPTAEWLRAKQKAKQEPKSFFTLKVPGTAHLREED